MLREVVYTILRNGLTPTISIEASGLPHEIFPEIVPSTEVLGHLTKEASQALGLPHTVKIVAGGVDNSCQVKCYQNRISPFNELPANPLLSLQGLPRVAVTFKSITEHLGSGFSTRTLINLAFTFTS